MKHHRKIGWWIDRAKKEESPISIDTTPKIEFTPWSCPHRTLHPYRVNGNHTVCMDCNSTVYIAVHTNEFNETLRKLHDPEYTSAIQNLNDIFEQIKIKDFYTKSPAYQHTFCAQCGYDLGPGNRHIARCEDHK